MPGRGGRVKAQGCGQFLNKPLLIHRPGRIGKVVVEQRGGNPGWRAQALWRCKCLSPKGFAYLSTEIAALYYSYQIKIFNYCC